MVHLYTVLDDGSDDGQSPDHSMVSRLSSKQITQEVHHSPKDQHIMKELERQLKVGPMYTSMRKTHSIFTSHLYMQEKEEQCQALSAELETLRSGLAAEEMEQHLRSVNEKLSIERQMLLTVQLVSTCMHITLICI